MFADIINNDKTIYCILWLTVSTWFVHYNGHLTVLHDSLIDYFHYYLFIIFMLLRSWWFDCFIIIFHSSHYMHVHLPLYFYTPIGSSNSLNLHIQVYICYLADQVFGEDHMCYEDPKVLFVDYPIWVLFLVFLIYSCWFSILFGLSLFYWLFIK